MGRIFFFLEGFFSELVSMLLGSLVICVIVGFFFFPALYVLIPICLIIILIEAFKNGVESFNDYTVETNQKKHLKKLKRAFNEHELFEFDKAWKNIDRGRGKCIKLYVSEANHIIDTFKVEFE